ncbi:MAG: CCA tRNA nucleotidyltransferase [Desulfobacula sp.]|nr:CCA tRNA nucleotidyltransferase [Desulfobacula sp.]
MNKILQKQIVQLILERLQKEGHQAYITGGAVRDIMLNKVPRDVDILTSATLEQIKIVFSDRKVKIVGKSFPICMVDGIDVSSGRDGFECSNFPESDLAKRDFTLNAMAYDPGKKQILDPFNGKKDLEKGVVRFTKDPESRINEDPIRMVRACRFAGMIKGHISLSSLDIILSKKDLLSKVAKERIRHEIIRAMAIDKPSLFFKALRQTRLLSMIFPSLDRCHDLDGGPHHGETVFEHCMMVGDALSANRPILRLAGYLHDVGKFDAALIKKQKLTFPGHEKYTKKMVNDLTALRFSCMEIEFIESLTKAHMRPLTDQTTAKATRRLLAMLEKYDLSYQNFMRMRIADKKGNLAKPAYTFGDIRIRVTKLQQMINEKTPLRPNYLKITGNDIIRLLNIDAGPKVGEVKQMLFEQILDNPELNNLEDLKKICLSLKIKE